MRRIPLAKPFFSEKEVDAVRRTLQSGWVAQGPQVKNALAVASRIIEGEELEPIQGDHPIYLEIRKDLGEEVFEA